jgi:hypothetical protein
MPSLTRLVRKTFVLIVVASAPIVGCGPANPLGRKAISGSVTLDGQPLDKGAIELHPIEGGVQSGDLIAAGKYSIPTQNGPTVGKYRVVIYDTYDTPPLPPGHMPGDDIPKAPKPKVPPDWNSKSQQTIEVKPAGPFKFDFEIVTKKK